MQNAKNIWYYIKNYKLNSLFLRTLLLIFILLAIPFASLSVIFYSNITNTIHDEIKLENSSILDSTKNITDSLINECDMLSSYIASNDSIQYFMLDGFQSDTLGDLTRFTKTLPLIYKYIDSVYVYSEYNNLIFLGETKISTDTLDDSNWLEDYKQISDRTGNIIAREKKGTYPQLITIIKPIYIADEKRGAVVMNIDSRALYRSVLSDTQKNRQQFLLINKDNQILLSQKSEYFRLPISFLDPNIENIITEPQKTQIYTVNGEKCVIAASSSERFENFTYISILPMTLYENKLNQMNQQIFITMLALFLLGFILAYIIAAKSYSPLREIISFLDETGPENEPKEQNKNELRYIMNSIEHHIEDTEKMREILEERMQMLKQSQYAMLQSQINPHFLYNTLETINWMAYDLSDSENPVSKALLNLAGFFRNTLSATGYLVPIETEIEYTKDYINILELRYGELFDVVWEIEPEVLPFTVIKICLQPIIENAVYHGLKPKGDCGLLTISGKLCQDSITFTVTDDGAGMSESDLAELNNRLHSEVYLENQHIGLVNVNRRIKIIFGNEYGINVSSQIGKGTAVTVTLPIIAWENDSPKM